MTRLAVLLGVMLAGAPPAFAQTEWRVLDRWVAAIEAHRPGRDDEALRVVAGMPAREFESALAPMVFMLHRAMGNPGSRPFDDVFRRLAVDVNLTPAEAQSLGALIARIGAPDLDPFLKRAAIYHTDVALFRPRAQLTEREGLGHVAADGREAGDRGRPWHWMLARSFLHLAIVEMAGGRLPVVRADADPDVRLWYQAVANYLWSERDYTEGLPHILRAVELFPDDPEIQFMRGLMHESLAAAHIQSALAEQQASITRGPDTIYIPAVGTAASERREAEDALRRAIALDPAFVEARLRLAHVLGDSGRHEEAVIELDAAASRLEHPWHRYFACLLRGRAEEARARPGAARDAYQAARVLFPYAQAPRLALSQLDLRAGDRGAALDVFRFLAAERPPEADPWWRYDAVRTPETAGAWIRRMREAFATEGR